MSARALALLVMCANLAGWLRVRAHADLPRNNDSILPCLMTMAKRACPVKYRVFYARNPSI